MYRTATWRKEASGATSTSPSGRRGAEKFGEKVEIKNLNSFKAVQNGDRLRDRAARRAMLDDGRAPCQETRLWDAERGETFSMRSKEEAHDYRYFPDPDLAPVDAGRRPTSTRCRDPPGAPGRRKRRASSSSTGLSEYDAERAHLGRGSWPNISRGPCRRRASPRGPRTGS